MLAIGMVHSCHAGLPDSNAMRAQSALASAHWACCVSQQTYAWVMSKPGMHEGACCYVHRAAHLHVLMTGPIAEDDGNSAQSELSYQTRPKGMTCDWTNAQAGPFLLLYKPRLHSDSVL